MGLPVEVESEECLKKFVFRRSIGLAMLEAVQKA
jgi:hypothetical protein